MQGAGLAETEAMQDRWAALLTAAANPNLPSVPPSFPAILSQLSPLDARVLEGVYEVLVRTKVPPEQMTMHGARLDSIPGALGIPPEAAELSVENLLRLSLIATPATGFEFVDNKDHRYQLQNREILCGTRLGWAFVAACVPRAPAASATAEAPEGGDGVSNATSPPGFKLLNTNPR
jgi:hypothetical protein